MGMHLSSSQHMSVGPFIDICNRLGLPAPEINDEDYYAVVTEEMYKYYEATADNLYETRDKLTMTEHRFLLCWHILRGARIEWLMKNSDGYDEPWNNIYFG